MKKIIALVFCSALMINTASAARLPRILKTPKTCKVVEKKQRGLEKSYVIVCGKPLSKRMRGWVFFQKTRFDKRRWREWMSRRGNWRLVEESACRLKTCKVKKITVYNIVGC